MAVTEDDSVRSREAAAQAGQATGGRSGVMDDGHGPLSQLELERLGQDVSQRRLIDIAVHRVDRGTEAFELVENDCREEIAGVDHRLGLADQLHASIGKPAGALRHVGVSEDGDHAAAMDLFTVIARIYYMLTSSPRALPLALLVALFSLCALSTPPAATADVGVERVSRLAGVPGEAVELTIGCGFCFPPCEGPQGDRGGVCMPGAELPPPSFPVSLVPIEKVPKPHRCGPKRLCTPEALAPPRRAPYTLLGWAKPAPPADDRWPLGGGFGHGTIEPPRYALEFPIPDLTPGTYAYVIYCGTCQRGQGGSLISFPSQKRWRLQVRPS